MTRPSNKALGKGLSALLPGKTATAAALPAVPPQAADIGPFREIALDQIDPNPTQPRTSFRGEPLSQLADSIRVNGIIQPLIVRPNGDRFELVAGERRWRAARLAGLPTAPVVIQTVANDRVLELALIENIQREDLNALETAQAFDRLAKEFQLSHEEIGRRTGKDRATISNFIRLLKLPQDVQILVSEGRLSMGQARAILALPTEELQQSLAQKAVSQGLSVRAVERLVQRMLEPREPDSEPDEKKPDPNVQAAIDELERVLGTRVRIVQQGNNRGRLEIEYYSESDLQRIYEHIMNE